MIDWALTRFRDFLRPNQRPYTLGPAEDANLVGMRLYGLGPFHRERKLAMQIAKKTHFVIKAGDVIYNKLFAWKGAFGIVPPALDSMLVSDKFPTYELDRNLVDERFLRWYCRFPPLWDQAKSMSTGSAALSKLTLNPPKFLDLTIPIPSLLEQRRIVARIEAIAGKVAEAKRLRSQIEAAVARVFFAGCEAMLRSAESAFPTEALIDLVEKERGISYGVVQTGHDTDGGVPTFRAGDVRWFECNTDKIKCVSREVERGYQRTRLKGGELLLRIRGGVGAVAVCPTVMVGGNVSREIAVIPVAGRVEPRYAMFMLAAPTNQERMTGHVRGTSYVGINLKDVRTLRLPMPPPVEQRRIVAVLDALRADVEALKRLQSQASADVDAMLPSVLHQAFRGEL